MTVRLHDERRFAASAEALFALWTDPAFQEARSRHLGTIEARCARTEAPLVLVLDEARETGFRTEPFRSRHTTRWDVDARVGRWTLEQTGGPGAARAEGELAIVADGDGARLILDGRLTVAVRIFGPMIERVAVRALRAERAKEARFVAAELARRR